MSIHIEARRWFQKTYGNTYHSVAIYKDGQQLVYLPYQYGYGDQWLQTAWEWIAANGYPELAERHANGMPKNYGTQYLREVLKGTYSVVDVQRKRTYNHATNRTSNKPQGRSLRFLPRNRKQSRRLQSGSGWVSCTDRSIL